MNCQKSSAKYVEFEQAISIIFQVNTRNERSENIEKLQKQKGKKVRFVKLKKVQYNKVIHILQIFFSS